MQYVNFTTTKAITNARSTLIGWAINCTVTGSVKIRDGAAGNVIATINLANGSQSIVALPRALSLDNSVYIEVVSGTFDGSIWVE